MRICQISFLVCVVLHALASAGQTSGPRRDPQAVTIVLQAINAAGGLPAVAAARDYTASGQVAFNWDQIVTANITLTERGPDFRLDAQFPDGTRTWFILNNAGTKRDVDGTLTPLPLTQTSSIESCSFPIIQLARALANPVFSISSLGTTVRLGRQVSGVRVRTLPILSASGKTPWDREYYFDAQTSQVVTVEDSADPNLPAGFVHQVQFSNFQQVQGVVLPLQIVDLIADSNNNIQPLTTITLNQVSINSGYSDTQFQA